MAKKQKLNLIEELTTHKNDFKIWPLYPVEAHPEVRLREEPATKPPPPFVQIDPQSHTPYISSVHVPFDLYLSPKPIVETDPRKCFSLDNSFLNGCPCNKRIGTSTILSPALPLNEVTNAKDLRTVTNFTYTGMHKILMREAALKISKRAKPPHRVVPEQDDLRYKAELYPPLPPGWIAAAKHWDCMQSRNVGDPTKTFWQRRGPEVQCSCCCNPLPTMVSKDTRDHIEELACTGKLSLAYGVTKTGYGGYRPMVAKGVPLGKP